ncbi:hypothetical protein C7974DRAFT_419110 [Boeremia exigua]|uniref:uncharacterized protein n=1 Tax=Boeremia exigua TaxID=749465 RepID=UPI001E8CE0CF|nr:uncharacterized protein C7974DRAFT_419110 [Boeremia exigua]KAH6611650.1 hypothetical protein C7974DRAFT_419110 [Boeremia exigua]
MAAAAIKVIGLMFGILSEAPMLGSMLPDKTDRQTVIRIGVGTSINAEGNTGGDTPGIRLFDVMGRALGSKRGSKSNIADGGYKDIRVTASRAHQGRQAQYILVSKGGNDALCISYIAVTWPDGQRKRGHWYNSQTIIGDTNYQPKCVWIDGDASNGIATQGLGIHVTDFTATPERAAAYKEDPETMCKSRPRFHLYDELDTDMYLPFFDPPLEYDENSVDRDRSKVLVDGSSTGPLPPRKRSVEQRGTALTRRHHFPGRLVTSAQRAHSARELCRSETSLGPDFVSVYEGLFCDMSEKELWPLCDEMHLTGCFDVESNSMVAGSLSRRDEASGRHVPEKEYNDVQVW